MLYNILLSSNVMPIRTFGVIIVFQAFRLVNELSCGGHFLCIKIRGLLDLLGVLCIVLGFLMFGPAVKFLKVHDNFFCQVNIKFKLYRVKVAWVVRIRTRIDITNGCLCSFYRVKFFWIMVRDTSMGILRSSSSSFDVLRRVTANCQGIDSLYTFVFNYPVTIDLYRI